MDQYGKVAVLIGDTWSSEHTISALSGAAVLESLLKSGVDAHLFDLARQSVFELRQLGFSRAVLMTHGRVGEDGILQGVLEYLQIPYTGSGVLASALSMDKYKTRLIWSTYDIPMPRGMLLQTPDATVIKNNFTLPIIIKPVREGSTIGLSRVLKWADLESALATAFKSDCTVVVEEMIIGQEFSITVCDGKVYPVVKVEAPNGDFDYQNKYFTDVTKYTCPYLFAANLAQQINDYAKLGYTAVGARSAARLDFMLDNENNPYFLEINTIPGMTSHSLMPLAYKAAGVDFEQLCIQILDGAALGG